MLMLNVCLVQVFGWIEGGCGGICLCEIFFGWVEGVGILKVLCIF